MTSIDPRSALVVIDLQKGLVSRETAHPIVDVVRNAAALAAAFRRLELPVVLVNVAGRPPGRTEQGRDMGALPPDWTEFVPELDRKDDDHVITKRTAGAFTNTDLENYLRKRLISQVVVAGIATSFGVESTARHAYELGFNVTLAVDAMTDISLDAHGNSVERIFPRIGEIGTTRQILDILEKARA